MPLMLRLNHATKEGYEKSRSERQQSNAKRARLRDFHLLTLALKHSWLDFRHEGLRGNAKTNTHGLSVE